MSEGPASAPAEDAATAPPPGSFMRRMWRLISPYFWSDERYRARLLLAGILALTVAQIVVQIRLSWWNADFFNALEQKDQAAFIYLLGAFALLAAASMGVTILQLYLKHALQLRWRRWLTRQLTHHWLGDGLHYHLQFAEGGIDNPDQRIAEDSRVVTDVALDFAIGILNSALMFCSFITILWMLSGTLPLSLFGTELNIPGYMVWFALAYAALGSGLTWAFGRPLVHLNADRNAREADFRFSLIRVRESSEGIALCRGEPDELRLLDRSFETLAGRLWKLLTMQRRLTWLSSGYTLGAMVFPTLVAAPRYFSGAITLGGLMQTTQAFGQVQGALSWYVENWPRISEWRASVERLLVFAEGLEQVSADTRPDEESIVRCDGADDCLRIEGVDIGHADGSIVVYQANTTVQRGEKVLIVGQSGSGKSTLFRAVAGLWPWGRGRISMPAAADIMFVPQRPYLPLGTLREAVAYPSKADKFDDDTIKAALERCGLPHFIERLDEVERWDQIMSGGEQQRVAFARLLLNKPGWVFMDEGTSALDGDSQDSLMALFREELAGSSLVSIGHREGLDAYHDRTLVLERAPEGARLVRRRRPTRKGVLLIRHKPRRDGIAARIRRWRKPREAKAS